MTIRNITRAEIPAFAENRYEFVECIKGVADRAEFLRVTEEYLYAHFGDGSYIARCAFDGDKIVSSAILCVYELLPVERHFKHVNGLLLNVFTLPEYRRQGLAFRVLTELFAQAKAAGVCEVYLDYTDEGYPLYVKLGFEKLDRDMVLAL